MDSDWEQPGVVVDCGSAWSRAGFCGEDAPRVTIPTLTARLRKDPVGLAFLMGTHPRLGSQSVVRRLGCRTAGCVTEWLSDPVHTELLERARSRNSLTSDARLSCPVVDGCITDWDEMEKHWRHIFENELRVVVSAADEEEEDVAGVMLVEPPLNPRNLREKATEIMFEKFGVRRFYMEQSSTYALYATGRLTGLVVDCGHDISSSVPIYDGQPLGEHYMQQSRLAGRHVTEFLMRQLQERSTDCTHISLYDQAEGIKTQQADGSEPLLLPDGSELRVAGDVPAAELLFRPVLGGLHVAGIQEMTHSTIQRLNPHQEYSAMARNILLVGGTAKTLNLGPRLCADLCALTGAEGINVVDCGLEQLCESTAAWLGGSIQGSCGAFARRWILSTSVGTAQWEIGYDEVGPSIIHRFR